MKLLIKNIKTLVQAETNPTLVVAGAAMKNLPVINNAWLTAENGIISGLGEMVNCPAMPQEGEFNVIDATGKLVFPSFCDSHSHLVFAGSREGEFVDRINGLSYEEIAARGGGILNSAKRLQETSEDDLFAQSLVRLNEVIAMGTGAIEIKSGYGLTLEAELKMLRVVKRLNESSPATIKATFLGTHAVPNEYKGNKEGYVNLVINDILPRVAEEKLADFIDIFCETNYFSVEDTVRIIEAGAKYSLPAKVHTNQFTSIGGIEACVNGNALSVDHLEVMTDKDIEALKDSKTIPTLLPSCSFFLKIPYGPARKLMGAGLPVALATDYNPGSTPSGRMSFVLSLACIHMGMTPEEAINATTINTAAAMGISETHGSIAIGKVANMFITKPMSSHAFMPYAFGSDMVEQVILQGKVV